MTVYTYKNGDVGILKLPAGSFTALNARGNYAQAGDIYTASQTSSFIVDPAEAAGYRIATEDERTAHDGEIFTDYIEVPMAQTYPISRDQMAEIIKETKVEAGGNHVLMYGPPGTGKTTMSVDPSLHWPDQPVYEVTLTDEKPAAELWGHYIKKGEEHVWMDGPAALAWKNGGVLVINEIQKMSQDVCDFLHVLLDDPSIAAHTNPNGVTLHPDKRFRCMASFNGTLKQIPGPVLDRFALRFPVMAPSTAMFNSLPADCRNVAQSQYSSAGDNAKGPSITFRELRNYAYFRTLLGSEAAAYAVSGSKEAGSAILEALRGEKLKAETRCKKHISTLKTAKAKRSYIAAQLASNDITPESAKELIAEVDFVEKEAAAKAKAAAAKEEKISA